MNNIDNQEILIIGGTGSLGTTITKLLKTKYDPRGIRIYSRDEYKQYKFRKELQQLGLDKNVAFLIGDIRDEKRLSLAMNNVDIAINCAAMKHVPSCNENPIEAIATNILGMQNVITAALLNKINKVMFISTDKSVQPANLYGATKMTAEQLCIHANVYRPTKFSCCRYGNVLGSRGSVIPLFKEQTKNGTLTITHKDMCRFWITLDEVSQFLLNCVQIMKGREIFVPKMFAASIMDIAKIICPECAIQITKPVAGEKLQEILITEEESKHTHVFAKYFIIHPDYEEETTFNYVSDPKKYGKSKSELKRIIETIK